VISTGVYRRVFFSTAESAGPSTELIYLFSSGIGHLHELLYFGVDIVLAGKTQVVIVLRGAGHLGYFLKAQILFVGLIKRKDNIHKITPQANDIGDPGFRDHADHGFGGMQRDGTNLLILLHEMSEQRQGVLGLIMQEIGQHFVAARMGLVGVNKSLLAQGTRPHTIFAVALTLESGDDQKETGGDTHQNFQTTHEI